MRRFTETTEIDRPLEEESTTEMSRERERSHRWLADPKGPPGKPFLPQFGQLYMVNTLIYGIDPAPERPAVVIGVPADGMAHRPIQLATRSSQSVAGVKHPADLALGCDLDGVFSNFVQVEQQLWRPENVRCLGALPEPYLTLVVERFS
ncbi:MAG: hypothetical protein JWR34_738 [Mycobacterium sp.]|nr:hypothetical protein [Mycobacterium sp.]